MLAIRDLSVFYGDAQALDGVSLEVGTGQVVALVGANGAGKTSLIRTVAGILKPRSGSIVFDGHAIGGLDSHRICDLGIGQVAEGRQVFPSMSVLENLQVGAMLPRARAQAAVTLDRVFAMFPKLKERTAQLAGTLSGGEQQMLAIGRCLMGAPRMIMFDEPSLGLSPALVGEVFETIRQLHAQGMTVLLVEQKLTIALEISQRCCVMGHGSIVFEGTPAELRADAYVRKEWLEV